MCDEMKKSKVSIILPKHERRMINLSISLGDFVVMFLVMIWVSGRFEPSWSMIGKFTIFVILTYLLLGTITVYAEKRAERVAKCKQESPRE
jgi:ABC-type multidrug transport system fused ATPase/permease subunit